MTQEHPITPSQELVDKWVAMLEYCEDIDVFSDIARWGAAMELDACCEWVSQFNYDDYSYGDRLRDARRSPKPPSLKQQALGVLDSLSDDCLHESFECFEKVAIIRRALESLPD